MKKWDLNYALSYLKEQNVIVNKKNIQILKK
jgi:hypothetical protein